MGIDMLPQGGLSLTEFPFAHDPESFVDAQWDTKRTGSTFQELLDENKPFANFD